MSCRIKTGTPLKRASLVSAGIGRFAAFTRQTFDQIEFVMLKQFVKHFEASCSNYPYLLHANLYISAWTEFKIYTL